LRVSFLKCLIVEDPTTRPIYVLDLAGDDAHLGKNGSS
jgi:hypothetical protein